MLWVWSAVVNWKEGCQGRQSLIFNSVPSFFKFCTQKGSQVTETRRLSHAVLFSSLYLYSTNGTQGFEGNEKKTRETFRGIIEFSCNSTNNLSFISVRSLVCFERKINWAKGSKSHAEKTFVISVRRRHFNTQFKLVVWKKEKRRRNMIYGHFFRHPWTT